MSATMTRDATQDGMTADAIRPTPATAGEPSPSRREAIARIIEPGAWEFRGLWPDGVLGPGPHRTTRIEAAERKAAEENERLKAYSLERADAILALPSAPASSLEGGGEWETVGPDVRAVLEFYGTEEGYPDHCTFSDITSDLGAKARGLLDRLPLAPHQPEGGDNGRG